MLKLMARNALQSGLGTRRIASNYTDVRLIVEREATKAALASPLMERHYTTVLACLVLVPYACVPLPDGTW